MHQTTWDSSLLFAPFVDLVPRDVWLFYNPQNIKARLLLSIINTVYTSILENKP